MPSSKSNKPAPNLSDPEDIQTSESREAKQTIGSLAIPPKLRVWFGSGKFALLFVIVLALGLRIAGMGWGLPSENRYYSLHPDEPIVLAYSQQIAPAQLNFDPGFYNYGTFYLTLLRISSDIAAVYGGSGEIATEADAALAARQAHLSGRWLSVLFGALTAGLVVVALWRRTHPLGAYLGGLAVAFAPGHVIHSRFQTVDVAAIFFFMAGLVVVLWQLGDFKSPRIAVDSKAALKTALAAGALIGLSAGTKYSGILAILGVALIFFLAYGKPAWRLAVTAGAASLVTFLISTPGALLNSSQFLQDVRYEMLHTSTGHGLVFVGAAPGFITQLTNLVAGYGFLLLLMSLVGIVYALRVKAHWMTGLLVFGFLTYVLIGRAEVMFFRYALPLIPVLAIAFGYWVGEVHRQQAKGFRLVVMLAMVAVGGVLGGGASYSFVSTAWMRGLDPRDEAGQWLSDTLSSDEAVGLVQDPWFWSVTLYPQMPAPVSIPADVRENWMRAARDPQVVLFAPGGFRNYQPWDPRLITELEPEWIVFTSFELEGLDRLSRMPNPPEEHRALTERFIAFRDLLEARYEVPETLRSNYLIDTGPSIHDLMYIRPQVWLWKKKGTSTSS